MSQEGLEGVLQPIFPDQIYSVICGVGWDFSISTYSRAVLVIYVMSFPCECCCKYDLFRVSNSPSRE